MKSLIALAALGLFAFVPAPLTVPETHVSAVEINTFGERPRTAVIYRDADLSIVDWRWLWCDEMIPERVGPGRYLACWNDQGKPRMVYCRWVIFSRTLEDVELRERTQLPVSKRRRL